MISIDQIKIITESMFYVLMSLVSKDRFGVEMVDFIAAKSKGRIIMGPGTLYTILARFEETKLIEEIAVEGRKRTYRITDYGLSVYFAEIQRYQDILDTALGVKGDSDET